MNARLFIKRNSATILSFVAVAGVVATAITSANATPKAVRALDTAKLNKGEEELTKIEKVKTVLPVYLPTIITGAATVVCILGSNVLNQLIVWSPSICGIQIPVQLIHGINIARNE